jgi:ribosomal protein S14
MLQLLTSPSRSSQVDEFGQVKEESSQSETKKPPRIVQQCRSKRRPSASIRDGLSLVLSLSRERIREQDAA